MACCGDGASGRQVTGGAAAARRRLSSAPAARRRCGLCWALVASALRRAVCGAGSRRSSDDSYQELQPAHHPEEDQVPTVSRSTTIVFASWLCAAQCLICSVFLPIRALRQHNTPAQMKRLGHQHFFNHLLRFYFGIWNS